MNCPDCGGKLRVYRTYHKNSTTTRHYARCTLCGEKYVTETVLLGRLARQPAPPQLDYDHVLGTLRQQMTAATFDAWVRTTRLYQYNGNGRVLVAVNNARALDWLTNRLTEVFNRALSAEIGHPVHVEFVLDQPDGETKR